MEIEKGVIILIAIVVFAIGFVIGALVATWFSGDYPDESPYERK